MQIQAFLPQTRLQKFHIHVKEKLEMVTSEMKIRFIRDLVAPGFGVWIPSN